MINPELVLIGAVAAVGVLHTVVPDHWVPITLIARQQGWTRAETARASVKAGSGHVLSTLAIALIVWIGGVAFAQRFGHYVDTAASLALIGFGGWIAVSALRETAGDYVHGHAHAHDHLVGTSPGSVHGPELQSIETGHGRILLSIFETGVPPPRFRLTGAHGDETIVLETVREGGGCQKFSMEPKHGYWESKETIPEPHEFAVGVSIERHGHGHVYSTAFKEHVHGDHGHGSHDQHDGENHDRPKTSKRTALLLILGSSPMVEGIPAFFAAGKYGIGLIAVMSAVFAATTIATYVVLCVYSTSSLQRVSFGPLEKYGEVISGAVIAALGLAFWIWPIL